MNKGVELIEGTKLLYIGTEFDTFHASDPYMVFLGYDSHGWEDIWVEYRREKICIRTRDVEVIGDEFDSH